MNMVLSAHKCYLTLVNRLTDEISLISPIQPPFHHLWVPYLWSKWVYVRAVITIVPAKKRLPTDTRSLNSTHMVVGLELGDGGLGWMGWLGTIPACGGATEVGSDQHH